MSEPKSSSVPTRSAGLICSACKQPFTPNPDSLSTCCRKPAEHSQPLTEKFRWILDEVPDWWKQVPGVQINVASTIAAVPNCELIHPGDWIIRAPDGTIRREINLEGRSEAKKYLHQVAEPQGEQIESHCPCFEWALIGKEFNPETATAAERERYSRLHF